MAIALCLLCAGAQAVVGGESALFSVGFEDGEATGVWSASPQGGAQTSIRVEDGYGKGDSLRVEKSSIKGFVQWQTTFITVETGVSYRVSTWLNTLPFDCKAIGGQSTAASVYYMISPSSSTPNSPSLPNQFGPTRSFYSTGSQWEKLDMTFTTAVGVDRVRISLVFAQDVIDILMDDFTLERLGNKSEYKPRYEPPVAETLMPLEQAITILESRPRATAEVRRVGQRPRLFLDNKESFPEFYVGHAWQAKRSQVCEFSQAGVKVYFIPYILGRGVYGNFGVWSGPGQVDFSEVDEMLWRVLRADPHGYIMFYLCTDPYPGWAAENNLDDVVTDQDGNKAIVDMHFLRWDTAPPQPVPRAYVERYGHAYVSQRLREDTGEVLRQFAEYIQSSLPGKAVIGYHVIGGNDGQMFQWSGSDPNHFGDYSPASLHAFRGWLRAKYSLDSRLQEAWCQPGTTLDTAEIPSAGRRVTEHLFLDHPEDTDIVDFNLFSSQGTVDTLAGFGQILRDTHTSPILLGTYYAGPAASVISHHATGYLLEKKVFNYLTSVLSYDAIRWPGGPGKAHQAWSSLLLHDTFGLSEADFRSWKTSPGSPEQNYHVARVETEEESSAMMRRDVGHMLAVGQGIWWYDMSGGWFSDPSIMRTIKETVSGYCADLKDNALPRSEVAVFIDEQSLSHLSSKDAATLVYTGINQQIVRLNSSGVPYHLYLQEDVANPRLPEYKLYLFLNPYHLSPAEREAILALQCNGRTLAFVHAPGIVEGSIPDADDAADAATSITGISIKSGGRQSLQLNTLPGNGVIETSISQSTLAAPVFFVDDPDAQSVAAYTNGQCAVAFKDCGGWKSVFFGGVAMNEFFFNALARYAGAWVAAPAGNAVYGNQNFLTIHALHPGEKEIRLLQRAEVTDLATGELIAWDTDQLTFPMKRGETRWFHLQQPSWFGNAWPLRHKIIVSGALTTETLTNFPVLVQFSDQTSSLFRRCQITGQDIVFTAADGVTKLAHDIDTYTPLGTKAMIAWVRMPELTPGQDTVLYMYYGNPAAADQQDKGAVWAEYTGVWHLGEDKPGLNIDDNVYMDSAGNGYHGKDYVSTNSTAGRIGNGANLDGDDYIVLNKTLYTTNDFTITAWVKPAKLDWEAILTSGSRYFMLYNANSLVGYSSVSNKTAITYGSGANLETGQWQHVTFRSTGEEGDIRGFYKNGVQLSSSLSPTLKRPLAADSWTMIGSFAVQEKYFFRGVLDEVRISDKALSPAWLATECRNVDSPSAYVTFGPEEGSSSEVASWPANYFACRQEIAVWPSVMTVAALPNFPMLVAITNQGNHVFSTAAANGHDIMFTAADGVTQLSHELEEYRASSPASLYAWVKLPVLHTSAPTWIYMYYGHNNSGNFQDKANVWSEGYLGVWHLNESVSNGQTNYDSTASAAHGVFKDPNARGGGDAAGKIAGADAFHGFDDHYVLTPGVQCSSNGYTVSAWVNCVTTNSDAMFESGSQGTPYFRIQKRAGFVSVHAEVQPVPQRLAYLNSTTQEGVWYYLTAVCAPPNIHVYRDGKYENQSAIFTNMYNQARANYIGRYRNAGNAFNGRVDELRISNVTRSPEWIQACYLTQNQPGANLLFGAPEFRASTGTLIMLK